MKHGPGNAARPIESAWDDYRSWPDDRRREIIGGEACAMTPAPPTRHPRLLLEDRSRKLDLCAQSGMREEWLVTPYPSLIEVCALEGHSYRLIHACRKEEAFRSAACPRLKLNLRRLFGFPLEPGEEIRMVKASRPPYGKVKPGTGGRQARGGR